MDIALVKKCFFAAPYRNQTCPEESELSQASKDYLKVLREAFDVEMFYFLSLLLTEDMHQDMLSKFHDDDDGTAFWKKDVSSKTAWDWLIGECTDKTDEERIRRLESLFRADGVPLARWLEHVCSITLMLTKPLKATATALKAHSTVGAQRLFALTESYEHTGRRRCFAQMTSLELTQFDCPTEDNLQIVYDLVELKKRVKTIWGNKGAEFRRADLKATNRRSTHVSAQLVVAKEDRASGFHHLRYLFKLRPLTDTPPHGPRPFATSGACALYGRWEQSQPEWPEMHMADADQRFLATMQRRTPPGGKFCKRCDCVHPMGKHIKPKQKRGGKGQGHEHRHAQGHEHRHAQGDEHRPSRTRGQSNTRRQPQYGRRVENSKGWQGGPPAPPSQGGRGRGKRFTNPPTHDTNKDDFLPTQQWRQIQAQTRQRLADGSCTHCGKVGHSAESCSKNVPALERKAIARATGTHKQMRKNAAATKTGSLNLMTTFEGDNRFDYDVHSPLHPREFVGCIADVRHHHTLHPQSCVGGDGEMHRDTHAADTGHHSNEQHDDECGDELVAEPAARNKKSTRFTDLVFAPGHDGSDSGWSDHLTPEQIAAEEAAANTDVSDDEEAHPRSEFTFKEWAEEKIASGE